MSQSYITAKGRVQWRNKLGSVIQVDNYRLKFSQFILLRTYAIELFSVPLELHKIKMESHHTADFTL